MRAGGHLLGPNGPGGVSLGAPGSTRNHGEPGGSQAGEATPLPRVKSPGTVGVDVDVDRDVDVDVDVDIDVDADVVVVAVVVVVLAAAAVVW